MLFDIQAFRNTEYLCFFFLQYRRPFSEARYQAAELAFRYVTLYLELYFHSFFSSAAHLERSTDDSSRAEHINVLILGNPLCIAVSAKLSWRDTRTIIDVEYMP
jgi:hypothetical protein